MGLIVGQNDGPEPIAPTRKFEAAERAGYGTDPNLVTAIRPWPNTLSAEQVQLIEALADAMLPATKDEQAPSAIGLAAFFCDWLSAPYADQQAHRTVILNGLPAMDTKARELFARDFIALSNAEQAQIVDWLSQAHEDSDLGKFFFRFRYLVVGGYYTSDVGMRSLGYRGNVALEKFAPVSPEVKSIIDDLLSKLGL